MTVAMPPLDPICAARARATDPRLDQIFGPLEKRGWTSFSKEVLLRQDSPTSLARLFERRVIEWKHMQKLMVRGELYTEEQVVDTLRVLTEIGPAVRAIVHLNELLDAHPNCPSVRGFSVARTLCNAFQIAEKCRAIFTREHDQQQAFTAGILHDVGLLMLTFRFPKEMEDVLEISAGENCSLIAAERVRLGFDHQAVGAHFVRKCKFSSSVIDAVACHHEEHPLHDQQLAAVLSRFM